MNLENEQQRPHSTRLRLLRDELARHDLDGFVVPLTDEHLSEYIGDYAERLEWLTGFQGSAATGVVLRSTAAIFVDSRYTVQVRREVDGRDWIHAALAQTNPTSWLKEHAASGSCIGYDAWLHDRKWVQATQAALSEKGAKLVPVRANPIDVVWSDRPLPSDARMLVHSDEVAGKTSTQKLRDIAAWLLAQKASATVLAALDSVAWTFNVRGADVANTPVALAYALVHDDSTADLFVAPEKITPDVVAHLGAAVRLHPRDGLEEQLRRLGDKRVAVDPERTPAAIFEILEESGARIVEERDPVLLPKSIKNEVEVAGHKTAQVHDGTALCRFLHWLTTEAAASGATERSCSAKLQQFREETGQLRGLAFETISAFGPNGAVIHYCASKDTDRAVIPHGLYLVDSGGQYVTGTTDVTRTIAIGAPTPEMRDRFTRVLKGHIALARASFPVSTRGGQLDILARQHLWAAGLDYAHGTGHGVGSFLCVHEGPQRIARTGDCSEPLVPGMILSNEPGYYKADSFGIRIENLVLVVNRAVAHAEREMLGFETLTFAPLDRELIDTALLTTDERAWVDSYHAEVTRVIAPHLLGATRDWLVAVTQPLN